MKPKAATMVKFGTTMVVINLITAGFFRWRGDRPHTLMFMVATVIWIVGTLVWSRNAEAGD